MFNLPIEEIVIVSSYLGIFLMMISNGFISFPSSQILYIISGYFAFTGRLDFLLISLVGAAGNTIGNIVLYELSRARGLRYITKFRIFRERDIRKVQVAFARRGAWFLFIGKFLNPIKVFIPIPAGIAKMNRALYVPIILVSSWLWSLIFLSVGYLFGKSARVFGVYAVIIVLIAFFVSFLFYRYMNSEAVIREIEHADRKNGNPQGNA